MTDSNPTNVLMLGWEYPPHISGGLGTACEGLTTALAPLGVNITFVVPRLYGVERAPHMHLISPERVLSAQEAAEEAGTNAVAESPGRRVPLGTSQVATEPQPAESHQDDLPLLSAYATPREYHAFRERLSRAGVLEALSSADSFFEAGKPMAAQRAAGEAAPPSAETTQHYGKNLFGDVLRFADRVAAWAQHHRPDVVHAHDWMTFPAATRVARMHGIPLVVHVHSLDQDRSGPHGNNTIVAIESAGVRAASRVVAVSHYTARTISDLHGVSLDRIAVVHNGVYTRPTVSAYREERPASGPVVLFLGRITYQKGPEYFVEAAAKVLEKVPTARFVMAGSGDMLPAMEKKVNALGISGAFEFPGFVRGAEVESLFSTADVYVMPSVSEPFGIAALEAMSCETPVILSRQSGASEVLQHALKVDFWDVQKLASQIISILTYPELRKNIVEMARDEVSRVHWEAAAVKVRQVYDQILGESLG
jgi:glycosyltransferase involved in cell wall biosynthesis